jgi:ribosomal protein S18 acetylase RimI-like enzyme
VSSSATDSLRRRPFAAADAEALIDFCVAHGSSYDASLLRLLMLQLTSDVAGVIVIGDGDGIALVATVIDRVSNGADAAGLETLGVRAAPAAEAFVRLVVEPAVAFARAGERRKLQIPLPPSVSAAGGLEQALGAAGFVHDYDSLQMRRPASVPAPAPPGPLPPGWSWATVDAARADATHAALIEMFRDHPATNLMPLPDFRQAIATGAVSWKALLDGDRQDPQGRQGRIAGLVRVVPHGVHGEIRVLGRAPAYRGQGLGPRLMAEGLRLLAATGAGDVELSVEAANERALDLYRRFGFEVVTRTPVFTTSLRG